MTSRASSWLTYGSKWLFAGMALWGCSFSAASASAQEKKKSNILAIWGDDVGVQNIRAYNHGIMGYKAPHIDRIARSGELFTDA